LSLSVLLTEVFSFVAHIMQMLPFSEKHIGNRYIFMVRELSANVLKILGTF